MAGMFYSLKEAAEKLNKTPEEVQEIVKQGKLREFRDGPNLLFKVDEVEALLSDTDVTAPPEPSVAAAEEQQGGVDEILLAPEVPEVAAEDKSGLTDADTVIAAGGTDVLGETTAAGRTGESAEDTVSRAEAGADETFLIASGETPAGSSAKESIEQIEEDVSLDSFGSGSGLLDLSLQADDTSLGGILDEIYAPEGEGQAQPAEDTSAMDLAAETEQMLSEQAFDTSQPSIVQTAEAVAYPEPRPDTLSNAFGLMLFLPLLAILYTAVVAIAAFGGMTPAILEKVQSIIWYVVIGLVATAGVIVGVAFMLTSGAGKATAKPKAKKQKQPKVKKEKKSKKKKEPEA